jgi:pimeloyl-ACP methyl ester carboxylesterase
MGAPSVPPTTYASASGYVDVGGARLYYEQHGSGRALVLLHGGLNTISSSFSAQIADFSKRHRVIGIEQVGHGHTSDTRPAYSYAGMAEDTAEAMRQLGVKDADIVGWSDGGIVALVLARRHPALVRRLVVSGASVRADGMGPEALRRLQELPLDQLMKRLPASYKEAYDRVTPDGAGHWPAVVSKAREMWLTPVILEYADMGSIQAPTLVVAGDHDFITLDHTLQLFRALPRARLCILPGTGHATFQTARQWLNPIILSFLEGP